MRKLRIWSHFLRKSLMENFIFCALFATFPDFPIHYWSQPNAFHCVKSVRIRSFLACVQFEWGKIRTRKSPNTDPFHAVFDCIAALEQKFEMCSNLSFFFFFFYIIKIYTFENKSHNHQVDIFLCTWDLIQQEPVQRSY